MKKILLLFYFLPLVLTAQEKGPKRIIPSLTDWIEEINNWPDSIYSVENIQIRIDPKKDSLLTGEAFKAAREPEKIVTTVNKPIRMSHWEIGNNFFGIGPIVYSIKNIRFSKSVRLSEFEEFGVAFTNCFFEEQIYISDQSQTSYLNFTSCEFKQGLGFYDITREAYIFLEDSEVNNMLFFMRAPGKPSLRIFSSKIDIFICDQLSYLEIRDSQFSDISLQDATIETTARIAGSEIKNIEVSGAQLPPTNTYIPFDQISGKIYVDPVSKSNAYGNKYFVSDTMDFGLREEYDLLVASYKLLLDRYQNRGEQGSYNAAYVELKDIETRHLEFLYRESPSFKNYFTWKINLFLKIFSAYGTEPARAIIFSLYVILFFALIYLLFPNSWDAHGKNRIVDRYRFFFKYLQRNAGVHEVYLEEKQQDLLAYEEFKAMISNSQKSVPRFFSATALPLYQWAVSGTRLTAKILSKVDVLKGTWEDLPTGQKAWKSFLLVGAFCIALIYDLTIKVLNALMLSINTFTTLGFGEIPIKGLPRYLAIIQGFIGWFMLTIFSVSLISQLLN
jgi:hypothetical protein